MNVHDNVGCAVAKRSPATHNRSGAACRPGLPRAAQAADHLSEGIESDVMATSPALTKIRRSAQEPLRDQILQRCRLMIMGGHVVPGQKLPLRPLAEEFNTSLMPVRDALNRLVADGALELSNSRTIRVPNMTDERLIELHEIRRSLEGLAAEYATPNLSNSAIDRAQQLIDEMERALATDDYDTYISSHYSFHFTIYGAAGRPTHMSAMRIRAGSSSTRHRRRAARASPPGTVPRAPAPLWSFVLPQP